MLNLLPLSAALVTLHLHLLEHPRRKHMLPDNHATPTALITVHNLAILRPGAFAIITDLLLFN
jgi:hypothetical protein